MSIVFFSFIFLELNQYIKQNIDEKTFIKKKSLKSFTKNKRNRNTQNEYIFEVLNKINIEFKNRKKKQL